LLRIFERRERKSTPKPGSQKLRELTHESSPIFSPRFAVLLPLDYHTPDIRPRLLDNSRYVIKKFTASIKDQTMLSSVAYSG
jgi:hypothetical protein